MPTATVNHKAQNLLEKLKDFNALFTLSDRTEKSVDQRKNLDLVQISNKQCQPGPAGQTFAGRFNCTDFQFLFSVILAIFIHKVLHLLDWLFLLTLSSVLRSIIARYLKVEGFFIQEPLRLLGYCLFNLK